MLHILWIIIKWILILLGILLGLLLILVLLLLFCPLRYRVEGEKKGDSIKSACVTGQVSWLLRAFQVQALLGGDGVQVTIRILGLSLNKLKEWKERRALKKKELQSKKTQKKELQDKELQKKTPPGGEWERKERYEEKKEEKEETPSGNGPAPEREGDGQASPDDPEGTAHPVSQEAGPPEVLWGEEPEEEVEGDFSPEKGFFARLLDSLRKGMARVRAFLERIRELPGRLVEKFRKIQLTIQHIYGNISWWKAFLSNERVRAAIGLVRFRLKGLLKHVFPTRLTGEVTFGFEDPSLTGKALAVLGMTFPLHKNCVQVTPLFSCENYFQGEVKAKGRIYGCYLVWTAIRLYFDKNIRYTINRWKKKEG